MPKTKPPQPAKPITLKPQWVGEGKMGEGVSSMDVSTAGARASPVPAQTPKSPAISTEVAEVGGVLADRARGLQRWLLARGYVFDFVDMVEAAAATEAASWRVDWPRHALYGELLWPCGHVQAQTIEGRREDWFPPPSHWRPLYVSPRLVTGARTKGLAGSVVSPASRAMSV